MNKILIVFGTCSEDLEDGTVKLVQTDTQLIVKEVQKLINDQEVYEKMSQASNSYGEWQACQKVVSRRIEKELA